MHQYHHKCCFLLCVNFQYVVVCVILILGQIAAVVIFYKFPQVVSNKEILFIMMLRVKSGIFGQTAKFGQRPCLVHILNIGIKIN